MDVRKLNDRISVAPQLGPGDMAEAARLGFRTIINNRPDGEQWGQPNSADVEAAAMAAGLAFIFQPVVSGRITEDNITEFQKLMAEVEGPVLAYCRTGTRCTNLWALAMAPAMPANDILDQAKLAGYDLSAMAPVLTARSGK